jgi:hypothetical protein
MNTITPDCSSFPREGRRGKGRLDITPVPTEQSHCMEFGIDQKDLPNIIKTRARITDQHEFPWIPASRHEVQFQRLN